jgi:S-adenosylmethionine:tRNA ribosyltransferase-isomerase
MSLRTEDYDYPLPEALIAAQPTLRREDSRMLVVHRKEGRWEHGSFRDFPRWVGQEDLVVLNDTRVIRARLFSDDGRVELLLLEALSARSWRCLVKPGKRMREGAEVVVSGVRARVERVLEDGDRVVAFDEVMDLERVGQLPLPPYFGRQAGEEDLERYQTVYARVEGSVAAPTAGLHFTPEILAAVPHAFLTLHVGAGTFRPVQAETITDHAMHTERYELSEETAALVQRARRVFAVGTTTTRVLESCALPDGGLQAGPGRTNIFIHPPYSFRVVDALLTNFHLPKSTLLMLVSAFAGRELILEAYREAVREEYRFYSYGDCMLLL